LWYRKPRFNNRTKKESWLPPSTQRKFDAHVTLINQLKKLLPIKNLTIEVRNFDIQKIENPDIQGIQYQQGSMFEYQNMRSFLMARENGKCQICNKEISKGNSSHIHHIISRSNGGTNREKNLALIHESCHKKLHKNKSFSLLKKNKTYKDATFMSIIRWKFREVFPDCKLTYGNETFVKRNNLRLEKTHYNDAFVIAGGNAQTKVQPITLKQKHKNNRVLQLNRKSFKPSIRKQRYSIQPYDVITVNNKKYIVKGCHSYGKSIVCTNNIKNFNFGIKKVEKIFHTKTIYMEGENSSHG
jgi:predicted metal-binding protein